MTRNRFEGKIAVITGGNSGIGLGAAKAFAAEGAKVVITGRDQKTLDAAAKDIGPGTLAIKADVSKLSDLDKTFADIKKAFGKIDALFVNAGIGKFVPFDQVTEAFFDETMNINLKGAYFTIQKAVPLMPKGSAIVLNASINAHMGMANSSVYGASKAAIINLAKTMSADLLGRGIRVNAISPGPITTAIIDRMGMSADQTKQTKDWILSQVPLKRFGTGEEIAAAVLYLTSPESAFVIGTDLVLDGGMSTL
jgi:NAD(P)-dependent dehydrogenase (short-subunit alcohol dehydrogenase family)